jgi:hypothetical protein
MKGMWNMCVRNDIWDRAAWVLIAFVGIGLSIVFGYLASAKAFDPAPYAVESNPF